MAPILEETGLLVREKYGTSLARLVVEKVVVGVFYTGVKLSNGLGGVSYTPVGELHEGLCCSGMARGEPFEGRYKGLPVSMLLEARSDDPLFKAVWIATINALSSVFLSDGSYRTIYDRDALELIDFSRTGRVSMVGAFMPFFKRLKLMDGIELSVVEKEGSLFAEDEKRFHVSAEKAAEVLPRSHTIILAASLAANGALDDLLPLVPADATVTVVGPTASFIPDALFRRGISLVSGTLVQDADTALEILSEGGGAHDLFTRCTRKINLFRQDFEGAAD